MEKGLVATAGTFLTHHFSDVDALASYLPEGRNTQLIPLDLQPFHCHSLQLNLGAVRVAFNRSNTALKVDGDKAPAEVTFVCLPHGHQRPVISHGQVFDHNVLFGFDGNRPNDMVFPAHTTHCSITFQTDFLATCLELFDRADITDRFWANNYAYVADRFLPLRNYLDELYGLMVQNSPLLHKSQYRQLILQNIVPLLWTTLPPQTESFKTQMPTLDRYRLAKQIDGYMRDRLDTPLTLTDLCQACGLSRRTLFYSFEQTLGVSPMKYLKVLRLQGVRRALQAANPDHYTVQGLAYNFGFWSMGHFARDYKTLFGESPAQTLAAGQL